MIFLLRHKPGLMPNRLCYIRYGVECVCFYIFIRIHEFLNELKPQVMEVIVLDKYFDYTKNEHSSIYEIGIRAETVFSSKMHQGINNQDLTFMIGSGQAVKKKLFEFEVPALQPLRDDDIFLGRTPFD